MSKQPRPPERRSGGGSGGGGSGRGGASRGGRSPVAGKGAAGGARSRVTSAKGAAAKRGNAATRSASAKRGNAGTKSSPAARATSSTKSAPKRSARTSAAGQSRHGGSQRRGTAAPGKGTTRSTRGQAANRTTRGQAAKDRAATFRRRRILVGVLALIVVAGVAFGAVQGVPLLLERFGPSGADPTTEPTEDSTGPDEEALANPVVCERDAVSLELGLTGAAVAAGSQVEVPVTITNTGQVPCLLDVGSGSLEVVVTSGDDTVWTTAQCPPGQQEQRILLATGAVEERTITWSGRRSAAECPSDTRQARAGTYRVQVSLAVDGGAVTERQALTLN